MSPEAGGRDRGSSRQGGADGLKTLDAEGLKDSSGGGAEELAD